MDAQGNIQVAKQAYANFKAGKIPAVLESMSETIEWQLPEIEGVSFSGKRRGKESVADFFSKLGQEQDVISFEPREFIAQDDKVVAVGTYSFRVKETRQQFTSDFAHVFTIQNGKVVRFQEFMDSAAVAGAYRRKAAA